MNTERIKEIQQETAYPDSVSVQQALLKVWNECGQEQLRIAAVIKSLPDFELQFCSNCFQMTNHLDNKCQKCKGNVL